MVQHAAAELIQALGAVAAAISLIRLGLAKRFPGLLSYLVFFVTINLVFGLQDSGSRLYFYSYVILEPLKCAVSIVAVRELFALTFEQYPGIRTAGRWATYTGVTVALSVSLLATLWGGGANGRSKLFYFELAQRCVVFTLALVIGALLCSLSVYPLHLSRNKLVSSSFFSALFLSDACRLFMDSLTPYLYDRYVDRTEAVFAFTCLLSWATLMKRENESPAPARLSFSNPREAHLLQQLTAFNRMVSRAARR